MFPGEDCPAGSQMVGKALSTRGHKKPDEWGKLQSSWMLMAWGAREEERRKQLWVSRQFLFRVLNHKLVLKS